LIHFIKRVETNALKMVEFESWLTEKLTNLGTDASVFSPYIVGILESEETQEEKEEGIDALLSDILTDENLIETVKKEIQTNWIKFLNQPQDLAPKTEHDVEDICEQMHRIMEQKNSSFNSNKKEQTEEEKKLKEAILASYAQVEDDGEEEEGETEFSAQVKIDAINNAEQVAKAQQEWRESQKAAAMAKKEKDKQDREKQKSSAEDRKKKAQEKCAKGERRSGR